MPESLWILLAFVVVTILMVIADAVLPRGRAAPGPTAAPAVGIGTVSEITDRITVEVVSVSGQKFTGRLRGAPDDPVVAEIRPGAVLLVAFDPDSREQLSLADDMVAIRAAFDRMLVDKGLVTAAQLDLIRHGIRSSGVVTAARSTGAGREDYREVVLDLMVRRPEGGQFPAHETTLIPATSLDRVTPGSVIDAYYRRGEESTVAVAVPPA
ncbi:hypothetical protein [Mycolicibacterium frederiksbergense]|jgi:hypothetical protein|uniref:hypothetical protein n=1 Tax=Mycolicibacterium frederiksbergense TaxID=117567 RepID=UPI00265BB9DB|nr:hypothetical protein [Mycolicibacterium frederiksbergense]MDO0976281.1 hypothetical protein [Mycolicibacterium frederiksbergense]